MKTQLLATCLFCGVYSIASSGWAQGQSTTSQSNLSPLSVQDKAALNNSESVKTPQPLSSTDLELVNELDPYGKFKAPSGKNSALSAPKSSEKAQVKGLFKDIEKLGGDIGKAGIKTVEGTKNLVTGADVVVKGADDLVKGAEAAPKALVKGIEATPKAVVKGTGSLVNDVAFPADSNSMDYDGDL